MWHLNIAFNTQTCHSQSPFFSFLCDASFRSTTSCLGFCNMLCYRDNVDLFLIKRIVHKCLNDTRTQEDFSILSREAISRTWLEFNYKLCRMLYQLVNDNVTCNKTIVTWLKIRRTKNKAMHVTSSQRAPFKRSFAYSVQSYIMCVFYVILCIYEINISIVFENSFKDSNAGFLFNPVG